MHETLLVDSYQVRIQSVTLLYDIYSNGYNIYINDNEDQSKSFRLIHITSRLYLHQCRTIIVMY